MILHYVEVIGDVLCVCLRIINPWPTTKLCDFPLYLLEVEYRAAVGGVRNQD